MTKVAALGATFLDIFCLFEPFFAPSKNLQKMKPLWCDFFCPDFWTFFDFAPIFEPNFAPLRFFQYFGTIMVRGHFRTLSNQILRLRTKFCAFKIFRKNETIKVAKIFADSSKIKYKS